MSSNIPAGQRLAIRTDFEMESKAKTAKCKICGDRIKNFARRCTHCRVRICSDCSEPDGESSVEYKAIATDFLTNGCWCGFPSSFNPAFNGRIPVVAQKATLSKTPSPKRKLEEDPDDDDVVQTKEKTTPPGKAVEEAKSKKSSPLSSPESLSPPTYWEKKQSSQGESPETSPSSRLKTTSTNTSDAQTSPTDNTSTSQPPRKRVRRNRGEAVEFQELPKTTKRRSRDSDESLEAPARNIVIIGAGHIGLFIAYELARKCKDAGVKHSITIVEMNDSPCELASGHSAGLITVQNMPEEWYPLVTAAAAGWSNLRDDQDFGNAVDFSTRVSAVITEVEDASPELPPTWLKVPSGQFLVPDTDMGGGTIGKVNVSQLTVFLREQCEALKVNFQCGKHICKIDWSRAGRMSGIQIKKPTQEPCHATSLPCNELIVAAGPFTKDVFSTYFPETPLQLRNYAQRVEWMRWQHPVDRSEAIIVPSQTYADACPVSVVADMSEGTLQLSAPQHDAVTREVRVRDMFGRQQTATSGMREVALEYVTPSEQTTLVDADSALVSTANGHNPALGKVASEVGGNVYLCYGFGHSGTTLAPGVGKLMAEMVMDEESSEDVGLFAVPKVHYLAK